MLHTCRSLTRDHDAAMDAYAHALEALREDGCRRLHAYVPDGRTRFASWLVVVTRRLVLDYFRRRYGRSRSANAERQDEQQTRRRLEDLIAAEIDPDQLVGSDSGPDADLRRSQLAAALARALDAIDSRDRLLLALRFEDERSIREIAAILGLASVFHVYRHLGRVLSAIRGMLVAQGVDGPEP